MAVIIAKDGRHITEDEALDYVLGYTCGNDISARTAQFKTPSGALPKAS